MFLWCNESTLNIMICDVWQMVKSGLLAWWQACRMLSDFLECFSWYHCYLILTTLDKPALMAISWHFFSSRRSTTESTSTSSGWNSMLSSLKNLTENTLENEAERLPKRKVQVAVVWPPFLREDSQKCRFAGRWLWHSHWVGYLGHGGGNAV